eukprot:7782607-Alexandrium_andersonii.AAC.1
MSCTIPELDFYSTPVWQISPAIPVQQPCNTWLSNRIIWLCGGLLLESSSKHSRLCGQRCSDNPALDGCAR